LQYSDSLNFPIKCPDGSLVYPNGRRKYKNDGWIWKWGKKKVEWAIKNKFIEFRKSNKKQSGWSVCYKNYLLVDNEGNLIIDHDLNEIAESFVKFAKEQKFSVYL